MVRVSMLSLADVHRLRLQFSALQTRLGSRSTPTNAIYSTWDHVAQARAASSSMQTCLSQGKRRAGSSAQAESGVAS